MAESARNYLNYGTMNVSTRAARTSSTIAGIALGVYARRSWAVIGISPTTELAGRLMFPTEAAIAGLHAPRPEHGFDSRTGFGSQASFIEIPFEGLALAA